MGKSHLSPPNGGYRNILRAINSTPLLSHSASQLLKVTADPEHELADVIQIVKCDSILTARLLRVVNSTAYDLLHPINSIDRAVAYLGIRVVAGIAIAESTSGLFNKPLDGYDGDGGGLWKHDLFCAIASRSVAGHAREECNKDLAFTSGLLHDIGKATLSEFLKGTSQSAVGNISESKTADYLSAEEEILGLNHARVGYELAKHWHLPEEILAAILHHHQPAGAPEPLRTMVYAVHLGDILVMMGGYGTGSDNMR